MHDAVGWGNIPVGAEMVAGYANGMPAWPAEAWARFPHAVQVRISVTPFAHSVPGNRLHVLDVENYDATPFQAPGWVQAERDSGYEPSVYCNFSTWASVINAFHDAGIPEPPYWIALYDGAADVLAGSVAKQYSGGPAALYDLSAVAAYWPGVDPAPPPSPPSIPLAVLQGDDMSGYLLPKALGPTPLAIPDGVVSIRFTTVDGTTGGFKSASLQVNWHGSSKVVNVAVNPDGTWPVVDIPVNQGGASIWRVDDNPDYVGYAFNMAAAASGWLPTTTA